MDFQIRQELVDDQEKPSDATTNQNIIVNLTEQLKKVSKLHKQVSTELPELLELSAKQTSKSKTQNRDLKGDGVLTLYLDENLEEESFEDEQSTEEEVKQEEEVYVPECDNERIAKLLLRS